MDESALMEIRSLSENARRHLQHKMRNGLQSVISSIEEGKFKEASSSVLDISDELRNMGL